MFKLEPHKFASNEWSQDDYDNKVVHGDPKVGFRAKGTRDPELEEVLPWLSEKRNAIDVGARYGSYTRSCHTSGFSNVYSFELMHECAPAFSRNIDLSRCTAWFVPILDKEQILGRGLGKSGKRLKLNGGRPVKVYSIDYFEFDNIDLLKIDIDSYDHLALKGCIKTIERNRPVVQMEWGSLQKKTNPTITEEEAWSCIKHLDYVKVGVSTNDNLILVPREKTNEV